MADQLTIRSAPPAQHYAALELLFGNLSPTEKAAQMALTLAAVRNRKATTDGLLVAEHGGQLAGVAWASSMGGKSALVWPPQLRVGLPESIAGALLQAIDEWMRANGLNFATAYLSAEDSPEAQRLLSAGYEQGGTIVYLACQSNEFPDHAPVTSLKFVACEESEWTRMVAIVDATYIATQDCPTLNNVRDTPDVLEGYRTSSGYSPKHWLIARHENDDVGCLLLADHARDNHVELVYMGVVPAARGKGFGTVLTRYAQWLARCAGRASVVLAVDAENSPAIRSYAECGFREWERRQLFFKSLENRHSE